MVWLAKLIFGFVGVYGFAGVFLALGWATSDGPAAWIAGVLFGGGVMAGYLVGWWFRTFRERAEGEARRGRVYFPVGASVASVLIFVALQVGGDVSAFTWAACGAFVGVFAVWFTFYVPRNWRDVRTRLGGTQGEERRARAD